MAIMYVIVLEFYVVNRANQTYATVNKIKKKIHVRNPRYGDI